MNNIISSQPKKIAPVTLKRFVQLKQQNLDLIESYQKANPDQKAECAGIDATILISLLEYSQESERRKSVFQNRKKFRLTLQPHIIPQEEPEESQTSRSFRVRSSILFPRINRVFGHSDTIQEQKQCLSDSARNIRFCDILQENQNMVYKPTKIDNRYYQYSKIDLKHLYSQISGIHKRLKRKIRVLQNNYRRMQIMKMVIKRKKLNLARVSPHLKPSSRKDSSITINNF